MWYYLRYEVFLVTSQNFWVLFVISPLKTFEFWVLFIISLYFTEFCIIYPKIILANQFFRWLMVFLKYKAKK